MADQGGNPPRPVDAKLPSPTGPRALARSLARVNGGGFAPHQGDNGNGLFTHPSTNRATGSLIRGFDSLPSGTLDTIRTAAERPPAGGIDALSSPGLTVPSETPAPKVGNPVLPQTPVGVGRNGKTRPGYHSQSTHAATVAKRNLPKAPPPQAS